MPGMFAWFLNPLYSASLDFGPVDITKLFSKLLQRLINGGKKYAWRREVIRRLFVFDAKRHSLAQLSRVLFAISSPAVGTIASIPLYIAYADKIMGAAQFSARGKTIVSARRANRSRNVYTPGFSPEFNYRGDDRPIEFAMTQPSPLCAPGRIDYSGDARRISRHSR